MSNKPAVFIFFLLAFASMPGRGQTLYISDELHVPLRSSPCRRCTILHQGLPAGTELYLVKEKDGWSHVKTPGGLDGWLESQYLVKQPIARDRLAKAETRLQTLEKENASLKQQLEDIQAASSTLESELKATQEQKGSIDEELANIRQMSANAINLHEQNQELLKRNRILQSEIDVLTAVREQLESDQTQKWFLYGALAVFLGGLLSVLIPKLKPRKKFSEWA